MARQELKTSIRPGDRVRDVISGVEGLCTGLGMHMTGCDTVGISRPVDKDGKVPDVLWVDANRCLLTERGAVTLTEVGDEGRKIEPLRRTGAMESPAPSRTNPS